MHPHDAPHHVGFQGASDTPHGTPMLFLDNLVKNLTVAEVLRKNILFSLIFHGLLHIVYPFGRQIFVFLDLSLKLSLTLPNKGKMLSCSYFRSFIK